MATKIQVEVDKQKSIDDLKEIAKGVEGVGEAAQEASAEAANVAEAAARIPTAKVDVAVNKQQAVSDLKEVQKGVEGVGAAAKQASADIASVKPASIKANVDGGALAAADELIAKLDEQEATATRAAEAAAGGFGKVGIAIAGVTAAIAAAKASYEAFAAVVKSAADSGDADAQRLVKSVESIGTAWDGVKRRIAETSLFQNLMQGATEFNKELATTVSTLGHLAVQMEARKLGVDTEGYDAAIQKQLELNEARRQMAEVSRDLEEFEKKQRIEALNEENKKLKTQEEVNAAIKEERQHIIDRAMAGNTDAKARELSAEKRISLERRLKQVIEETEQAAKDAAKEELDALKENEEFKKQIIKDQQELARKQKQEAEEEAKIHERFVERELNNRVQAIRDALLAELKADAEAKAARLKMDAEYLKARDQLLKSKGQDPGIQGAAQQVAQQAADPREIIKRLADNAAEVAEMQIRSSQSVAPGVELSTEQKQEVMAARRRAYIAAQNQANGGRQAYSPEQIQGAMQQNVQGILKNVGENANVSAENLDATGMLAQEFAKNSAELAQMSGQVQAIMKQVGLTAQQNQRRRSQSGTAQP